MDEWRGELQRFRTTLASKSAVWQIEVDFVDALLAVLDDQPTSLPDDNPYRLYVLQVIETIASCRKGT
ncbi:MAG: hypothetical protein IT324_15310 [Anaerolineae bacterium]|nr:hypothetical protein [Anaerolineae bacterium]